ncbi:rhamnose binding lectin [Labeo rohita]|uniref:Rhamnose binding lectin n=1 Tax=Labeo rohita TaxID=84645 RepID=A0A498LAM4_LABRO|nr:rhamnose binding lectin [Labeo rohita]
MEQRFNACITLTFRRITARLQEGHLPYPTPFFKRLAALPDVAFPARGSGLVKCNRAPNAQTSIWPRHPSLKTRDESVYWVKINPRSVLSDSVHPKPRLSLFGKRQLFCLFRSGSRLPPKTMVADSLAYLADMFNLLTGSARGGRRRLSLSRELFTPQLEIQQEEHRGTPAAADLHHPAGVEAEKIEICEGESADLNCGTGVISVHYANYGRRDLVTCPGGEGKRGSCCETPTADSGFWLLTPISGSETPEEIISAFKSQCSNGDHVSAGDLGFGASGPFLISADANPARPSDILPVTCLTVTYVLIIYLSGTVTDEASSNDSVTSLYPSILHLHPPICIGFGPGRE